MAIRVPPSAVDQPGKLEARLAAARLRAAARARGLGLTPARASCAALHPRAARHAHCARRVADGLEGRVAGRGAGAGPSGRGTDRPGPRDGVALPVQGARHTLTRLPTDGTVGAGDTPTKRPIRRNAALAEVCVGAADLGAGRAATLLALRRLRAGLGAARASLLALRLVGEAAAIQIQPTDPFAAAFPARVAGFAEALARGGCPLLPQAPVLFLLSADPVFPAGLTAAGRADARIRPAKRARRLAAGKWHAAAAGDAVTLRFRAVGPRIAVAGVFAGLRAATNRPTAGCAHTRALHGAEADAQKPPGVAADGADAAAANAAVVQAEPCRATIIATRLAPARATTSIRAATVTAPLAAPPAMVRVSLQIDARSGTARRPAAAALAARATVVRVATQVDATGPA
jgi:hypothetical protein